MQSGIKENFKILDTAVSCFVYSNYTFRVRFTHAQLAAGAIIFWSRRHKSLQFFAAVDYEPRGIGPTVFFIKAQCSMLRLGITVTGLQYYSIVQSFNDRQKILKWLLPIGARRILCRQCKIMRN